MRIAVDAACLANERGYGRFARELLAAMVRLAPEHEFVLLADRRAAKHAAIDGARVHVVEQRTSPTVAAASDGNRSPLDMLRFSLATRRVRADVFFSPSVYTYFPLPPRLPAVVTIHDAIAERFPLLTLPSTRARLFWRLKTRLALAQSRIVLTVSEFAAREIQEVHGVPPHRIRVAVEAPASVYQPSTNALDVARAAAAAGVPDGSPWFVYVGGFNPHKRLDLIVRAHAAVAKALPSPPHLILVGALGAQAFHGTHDAVREEVARAGSSDLVHWPGFVEDEQLRHLLTGAVALLLPSENEGFGLPAVEAAACATPVIATTASPLPQLLAGGGIFVNPGDEAALVAAMRSLLFDPQRRDALGAQARVMAGHLSWSRAAESALAALVEARG